MYVVTEDDRLLASDFKEMSEGISTMAGVIRMEAEFTRVGERTPAKLLGQYARDLSALAEELPDMFRDAAALMRHAASDGQDIGQAAAAAGRRAGIEMLPADKAAKMAESLSIYSDIIALYAAGMNAGGLSQALKAVSIALCRVWGQMLAYAYMTTGIVRLYTEGTNKACITYNR